MMHSTLADWLKALGLGSYLDTLTGEGYEKPSELLGLQEADLEKFGFKMKHRKELLKALSGLKIDSPPAPSLPAPSKDLPDFGRTDAPLKLFLSYGRDDLEQEVRALRNALRARGHEVWFDEEQLDPGKNWDRRIRTGRNC